MNKLALIATVLLMGACVAEDTTESRVYGSDVADNDKGEVAIPVYGDDAIDEAVVIITGVEVPDHEGPAAEWNQVLITGADLDPQVQNLCAIAEGLDGTTACSYLCDPPEFAARLYDRGTPGGCTQTRCPLPGGTIVNVDVCMPGN